MITQTTQKIKPTFDGSPERLCDKKTQDETMVPARVEMWVHAGDLVILATALVILLTLVTISAKIQVNSPSTPPFWRTTWVPREPIMQALPQWEVSAMPASWPDPEENWNKSPTVAILMPSGIYVVEQVHREGETVPVGSTL